MINKEAWDVFSPRYQIELLALLLQNPTPLYKEHPDVWVPGGAEKV
jgi:hypothetical protein